MLRWLWNRTSGGRERPQTLPQAQPGAEALPEADCAVSDDDLDFVVGGLERTYLFRDPGDSAPGAD